MQIWLAAAPPWLWIVFTLIGATAQTARNAMQRELTQKVGTAGATHVRFLFGLPFSFLFLGIALTATGLPLPHLPAGYWPWLVAASVLQVVATGLMLKAMTLRSFVVATAYIKTEPVLVALFGVAVLGDVLTLAMAIAIMLATIGVIVMSWRSPGAEGRDWRPALWGIVSAGCFALSAVGYRGAILQVATPSFVVAASVTLVAALAVQTVLFTIWLLATDRAALIAILRLWRQSAGAGFLGALGSQFWFLAFSLTSAANVRTFALVEVLMAQGVSVLLFRQKTSARELLGIAAVVAGVALLLMVVQK